MIHDFTLALLQWYDVHQRDLPWRHTSDPYAIWLSEIILQQTRIAQGLSYWERFLERWPDVWALAAATEDEVLREWQGLGYYSRARNLHAAACQIAEQGAFPSDYTGIRALKGVGDYTAAAVASFAFGLPYAAVDGNAYRVLSRVFGIDTPIDTTVGKKTFATLAQSLLPCGEAARFNQAMMDFGATQCIPQSPACGECPMMEMCEAFRRGCVQDFPVKQSKPKVQTRHLSYTYVRYHGQVALHQRGSGDIWQGLWEPILVEEQNSGSWPGVAPTCVRLIKRNVRHVLTHRVLLADFYLAQPTERPTLPEGYIWVDETALDCYALPKLIVTMRQAIEEAR